MPFTNPETRRAYIRAYHQKHKNDPAYKAKRKILRNKYIENHKELLKEKRQKYEKANPEKKRIWQAQANKNRKLKIIELLGGKCKRCGITDFRVLQVDHIKGDGADERRIYSQSKLKARILAQLKSEPEEAKKKYQLLCANCNWIKIWENKEYN